ncbi:MAG TPA: metallophosphoesterase [Phycisphaerales bacterium]|nr:metallophosphoesterase [Phycisphaerales bacterium]
MSLAGGQRVRVAAVGDLHAHAGPPGAFRGLMDEMSARADVAVLCGDLTNTGTVAEAEALAADLAALRIPAVAVLGNHDHHSDKGAEVDAILRRANVLMLGDETFQLGGVGFAGVKGFGGGFGTHMLGAFGEEMTKLFVKEAVNEALRLENALHALGPVGRSVVVMHYSPIAETVVGEPPEIFPFMGCARLAETVDRFEVAAVFHGHAHHGTVEGRTGKGVPVYNCCLELLRRRIGAGFIVVEV